MNLNVNELIQTVRDQLDEENVSNVSDRKILAALNRGQRKATNIIARKYDSLFMVFDESLRTVAGQKNYAIPAAAFGRRLEKVELVENEISWEIRRIAFNDTTRYSTQSQVTRPYYYAIVKNEILLFPKPSNGLQIRLWYLDSPQNLVKPEGRITDVGADYVLLDELGEDISTDTTDGFSAYVNVVDYNTGDVKGSLQVADIDTATNKVTFKSGGLTRSTVLGQAISTELPADISTDDYLSLVTGTCIPEIPGAYTDYLIQYAVVEIRRSLAESTTEEYAALKELEQELISMWVGRESSHRVRKASTPWGRGLGSNLRRLLS